MANNTIPETVLVTGGTGFVAGWCITKLLQQGYSVRTTIRSRSKEDILRQTLQKNTDTGGPLTFYIADLTSDDGWKEAIQGCDYVLHVASPLGNDNTKDPDALIVPAREGTLRVLRAATNAGVKRVVMTSSCAAVTPLKSNSDQAVDESFWSDPESKELNPYRKSKVLAEMAAWEYMRTAGSPTTLTTILPGAVFGPVLSKDNLGSLQVFERIIYRKIPGNPRIGFEIVDVRDLADLHIIAMKSPGAAGQRFIALSEQMWMADIARAISANFGTRSKKVVTKEIPDFILRLLSIADPSIGALIPMLGRKFIRTSAKAKNVLGWQPRPAIETVLDSAKSIMAFESNNKQD